MVDTKELVGRYAANYVKDGMVVGLGTGSTAYWFVEEVGARIADGRLKQIVGVATSRRTAEQALKLGITIMDLDRVNHIDLVVDGADEVTRDFYGIKGGGGALLHEKIVAKNAKRSVWVVGEDKVVDTLGAFPLPVEVVQFGSWNLFRQLMAAGLEPSFRKVGSDSLYMTDSGNYIIDLKLGQIPYPHQLAHELKNTVGVVEHGLFLDVCDTFLVGRADGTILLYQKDQTEPMTIEVN